MSAVSLREAASGVVQITMEDREHKNLFSRALIGGLMRAFDAAAGSDCRVVVLTGYDNYFASGGTREDLLSLHAGAGQFTDASIYSLPLRCDVPVIAAMQGHGIGGGFVLGLFADCVVLSRESVYTANFMKYGFTPGMGATLIVPRKLGIALAEEMLLSARSYRGGDLEKRGVPFPVLPRGEVLPYALALARDMAEKPRLSLVALKRHLVHDLRARLADTVQREVGMHEQTFSQPEVGDRIRASFGR